MSDAQRHVGVIGLGDIGSGVARLVAQAGHRVLGVDTRPERLELLAGIVVPVASPAELAGRADVIVITVYDDEQVRAVLAGRDGVFGAPERPRVLVIVSTVSIETIQWAGEEAAAVGISVLDCGVAGGGALRSGSRIVAMLGGEEAGFAIARPVLEAFASPVARMGALGSGMRAKLARNMLHYGASLAEWEGARLAVASGIDLKRFIEIVEASEPWSVGRITRTPLNADLSQETLFAGYAAKDLRSALELGTQLGLDLPVAAAVGDVYGTVADGGETV
jgi:3-hydroxyisobutyrate dehydrogenase